MGSDLSVRQDQEWELLLSKIKAVLDQYGKEWHCKQKQGDYCIRDDNWGRFEHRVEIQNLELFRPPVIKALQSVLAGYPDWEIRLVVDVPDKPDSWPGMGVIVADDEIIDHLQREYLPETFQDLQYDGSRPPRRLFW